MTKLFWKSEKMDERRKKIAMIGPVYPYKGGIAQYTGMMYRALKEQYDVLMVSYKMQYPKFMFKKEQKDYNNDTLKITNTNYWINTANPMNIIISAKKIKQWKPDVVLIQWWHPYFAPCYWILRKMLGKIKVIYVCHNVYPHERFLMDKKLTKLVLQGGDGFLVHSKTDAKDLQKIKENATYMVAAMPTFDLFSQKNMTGMEARKVLKIEEHKKVILFFGFIREYKGLKYLLKAMPQIIKKISDVKLLIVGDFGEDKTEYVKIIEEQKIEKWVELVEGYVPDCEVQKYFLASNVVVLPYKSATQSAVVQTAYSFCKPVIVTNVGGLPDVVTDGETGYIVQAEDSCALAEAVIKYFKENKEYVFSKNIEAEAYIYSWGQMVKNIEELWKKLNIT